MKNLSTMPRMQRLFVAVLLFSLMSATSFAQSVWSGNGHTYEAVYAPGLTWAQAQATCEARGGYLATITSAEENDFIKSLFENNSAFWYFDGANALGPWIGGIQASGSSEPGGGWGWFNGESFSYTDWSSHDPDNCCGLNQNRIEFIRDGNVPPTRWTDVEDFAGFVRGYIFESSPSTTTCVPAPSGLVSWWPGENNANDIQSSNHGALQNGATFASGKVGQAISFDGVDDFILVPHNSNLAFGSGQDFTIDAWINLQNPVADHDDWIVLKADIQNFRTGVTTNFYGFYVNRDTRVLRFDLYSNSAAFQLSGSSIPIGQWVHVTAVREGSMGLIYINGMLDASATLTAGTVANTDPLVIGGVYDTFFNPPVEQSHVFGGLIDEVDIFNRALTAQEIADIYNANSAGKCMNTPPPVCVNPPSGLVSWWPGDDNANDIQDGNDGTLQNGATFAAGKVGQAFSFDGVDDQIIIPDNPPLRAIGAISIELWVNFARLPRSGGFDDSMTLIEKANDYYVIWRADQNYLQFVIADACDGLYHLGIDVPLPSLQSGEWHHFAFTAIDGGPSGFDLHVFVDGVEQQGIRDSIHDHCGFFIGATGDLHLGTRPLPEGVELCPFEGLIDEVSIYNRALSASEIQSLYNAGSAGKCNECTPPEVSITGNESMCPNSRHVYAATTNAINPSFNWSVTGGTINGSNTGSSINVTAGSAGTMTVNVEVADGTTNCNNSAVLEVSVEDHEPPVLRTFPAPHSLWPPNHQYETFLVANCVDTVGDNCTFLSPSDVVVAFVTSDEPEDAKGNGDGNTRNDIVIASDCKSVQLRSEREGSGNGRVYTIHLAVSDGNGNTSTATCLVTVPKSQNGNPAINNGPAYTVTGSCNGSLGKLAGVSSDENAETMTLPESYALEQNYPNPFNPSTVIGFQLPVNSEIKLGIYSLTGQLVRELVNGEMNAGRHAISWDGRDRSGNTVAAGMYLYRLVARGANGEVVFTQTLRMAFVK